MKLKNSIGAISLLAVVVMAGCSVQTNQPSTVPALPTTNQNVTGLFAGINAVPGGNSTIKLVTSNGTQTLPLAPNATFSLSGQACSLNDLAAIQAGNTTYNCSVLYNSQIGVFGVYVTGK
jgi:ABC-type Fe3+-hydroxamate transport system substrate-binding protein